MKKHWLNVTPHGLYCIPGAFYIDPTAPVDKAVVTHAHADHAISGHKQLVATLETIEIMRLRYGEDCAHEYQILSYHEPALCNEVMITLLPAGHIIGSAQLLMEYNNERIIVSGDYKRREDSTCSAFYPQSCDVFITEATFGLPVFHHPPMNHELNRLIESLRLFPDRCHLLGVYALGKCQRVLMGLRALGYSEPIYLHGALVKLCNYYQQKGFDLGELRLAQELGIAESAGKLVLCPPSALREKWSRRFAHAVRGMASGWMQIRARAKQLGVELPLVISDHADWSELTQTLAEVRPRELWVTHGQEDALVYYAQQEGYQAQALHLLGYDEEKQ
ncbi:MAG: DNA ligase-associated DEXH box helicase [Legionella sp. 40-6]|nr:ligase-associated DNA damage response exonuclease [Legionella sp.]OJY48744.1 MAG: DNA ligase-associated DEXH box helicase [Legionella sp. 40-6]